MTPEAGGGSIAAGTAPFNHRYFIEHAARAGGRVLDYGCGTGDAVALGIACGLDIWGADNFGFYQGEWSAQIVPGARGRVRNTTEGAPFPDRHFDVVFCNQVLEHVAEPAPFLAELRRMLRPGGLFMASFPVRETWYEGHAGLYFAHRVARWKSLRHAYFRLAHRLGFGLVRDGLSGREWVAMMEDFLDRWCYYRRRAELLGLIGTSLGAPVEDWAVDYMRARLAAVSSRLPAFADPLLRLVCHLRGGQVIGVLLPRAPGGQ